MRRMKWIAVLAMMPVVGLAACGGGDQAEQAPATQQAEPAAPAQTEAAPGGEAQAEAGGDMVAAGQQIFNGNGICFTCHGMDGVGSPLGPDLTSGSWLWVDKGGDVQAQVEKIVREGVSQPKQYPAPMPPMAGVSLTDEQIRDVAAYVVSISGGKS